MTSVFICDGQDLTVELLDDEADHKERVGVFLRHDDKDGRFFSAELLGVYLRIEAQELLQFRVQEGIESGQRRGHDRRHTLFSGIQRGSGEPLGFVIIGEHLHELLELIFALLSRGRQQLLNDFENGHDVAFLRLAELCHQQDRRSQKSFSGVVEICILSEARRIHAG